MPPLPISQNVFLKISAHYALVVLSLKFLSGMGLVVHAGRGWQEAGTGCTQFIIVMGQFTYIPVVWNRERVFP